MRDFTAELEEVFGVAPNGETGLVIDTFDRAGLESAEAKFCGYSVSPCRR